jgi:hypothetical protein
MQCRLLNLGEDFLTGREITYRTVQVGKRVCRARSWAVRRLVSAVTNDITGDPDLGISVMYDFLAPFWNACLPVGARPNIGRRHRYRSRPAGQ